MIAIVTILLAFPAGLIPVGLPAGGQHHLRRGLPLGVHLPDALPDARRDAARAAKAPAFEASEFPLSYGLVTLGDLRGRLRARGGRPPVRRAPRDAQESALPA